MEVVGNEPLGLFTGNDSSGFATGNDPFGAIVQLLIYNGRMTER